MYTKCLLSVLATCIVSLSFTNETQAQFSYFLSPTDLQAFPPTTTVIPITGILGIESTVDLYRLDVAWPTGQDTSTFITSTDGFIPNFFIVNIYMTNGGVLPPGQYDAELHVAGPNGWLLDHITFYVD